MDLLRIIVNVLFTFGVFINAALFLPQALKIFRNRNAHGLSLITFGGFNLLQLIAMFRGYLHHDTALTIGMGLSFISCGAITLGILIFKDKAPCK